MELDAYDYHWTIYPKRTGNFHTIAALIWVDYQLQLTLVVLQTPCIGTILLVGMAQHIVPWNFYDHRMPST